MHPNNYSKKVDLHNKNLLSLLKYHVYKVQKFDKNKDNLFAKIITFQKFSFLVKKKDFWGSLSLFIRSPFYIIRILSVKMLLKVINELKTFFIK